MGTRWSRKRPSRQRSHRRARTKDMDHSPMTISDNTTEKLPRGREPFIPLQYNAIFEVRVKKHAHVTYIEYHNFETR